MSGDTNVQGLGKPIPLPELKINKSGYEIRSNVLGMATDLLQAEYSARFAGWEISQRVDQDTGEVVSTVEMPEFPGLDKVLETAERMYQFVQNSGVAPITGNTKK
jgi:hypothetical protein